MPTEAQIDKLLQERYYLSTESSWKQVSKRLSKIYPPIHKYILNKEFIPSSPTIMNANTKGERYGTLSSCFPMKIGDSIEGIMDTMKNVAQVTRMGGGVGLMFDNIRGDNEMVKSTSRNSGGPLSFIGIYNSVLDGVRQGGVRRGAGMSMLNIYHPNIWQFITAKNGNDTYNRNNFSIRIPDSFYLMLDEEPNRVFKTVNVVDKKENILLDDNGNEVTYQMLWDKIVDSAWLSAEPGIFNSDIAYNQCTVTNVDEEVLSNPCLPKWAKILTKDGIKELKDINIGDVIWSKEGWTEVLNKWSTGIKDVYEYSSNGATLYCTDNHRVVSNGDKIEVKDAKSFDVISAESIELIEYDNQAIMDGLVLGDGSTHKASNNLIYLCIGENDSDYFDSEIKDYITKYRSALGDSAWEINTKITSEELPKTYLRRVPSRYMSDIKTTISFLRGLYSANGSVCGNRITLKQASKKLIIDVQVMLSSIGISSYITTNKSKMNEFRNGIYECKESYDLNITSDRHKFRESIGFIQRYKMDKIKTVSVTRTPKSNYNIVSSKKISNEEVFDITVDNDSHTFWCNGVNISNCSEYTSIPNSSCNLGSIDVAKFVINGILDKKAYIKTIKVATRFLNNVIDNNKYPIQDIEDVTLKIRPMGLGFMGLAHAMFKLGISYDSVEGVEFAKDIIKTLTLESMRESIELAKVDGSYEAFDYDLYVKANSRIFEDVEFQELLPDIKKYGIRNHASTSIAPTGTISYIANTSSGIEPIFALSYIRRIEHTNREFEEVYMTDDIFDEFLDTHYRKDKESILKEVIANNGSCQKSKFLSKEHKDIFKTSNDLTPMQHLDVLAIVARYVSMSISKTINLPKDVSKDVVSEVYREAHKRGVIGVTVYRDGSRDGILITSKKEDSENTIEAGRHSPKRPKDIECEVNITTVNKKQYYVIIGFVNGNPYEVFTGENYNSSGDIFIPRTVKNGTLRKIKKGNYIFIDENNNEYSITNGHSIPEAEALSRQISLNLRHNIPIQYIVEQLLKGNHLVSFHKAVARTLKKYIKNNTESTEKCPNCGGTLVYISGCVDCRECGMSKCS